MPIGLKAKDESRLQTALADSVAGSRLYDDLLAMTPVELTDPGNAGAIPVTKSGVCHLATAGAETRTMADPKAVGLRVTLFFIADLGNCVVTMASPVNQVGNNTITFANVGESCDFVSVRDGASAYRWALVNSNFGTGGALSTV